MILLMDKTYISEALYDIDSDIYDAISAKNPAMVYDDNGFLLGTFRLTLEWIPPEEEA